MMRVGFEPTPFRTRSLVWRLRPLGHLTVGKHENNKPTTRLPFFRDTRSAPPAPWSVTNSSESSPSQPRPQTLSLIRGD